MENLKRLLFSSFITEEEEQETRKYLEEETGETVANEQVWEQIRDDKNIQIEDLQNELSSVNINGQLIAIVDMGLWYGRKAGYKLLETDLGDILNLASDYDDVEIFTEDNELKMNLYHHDGTHFVTIRDFKPTLEDEKKDDFISKILNGEINKHVIGYYTLKLGDKIEKMYV